jgi:hypothetical protein
MDRVDNINMLTMLGLDLPNAECSGLSPVQATVQLHHQATLTSQDRRGVMQSMKDVALKGQQYQ